MHHVFENDLEGAGRNAPFIVFEGADISAAVDGRYFVPRPAWAIGMYTD